MALDYCARWRRLSHITSVHRIYGDYVSFVCIDKPWMIHWRIKHRLQLRGAVLSELLRALFDVGYFPPNTPPGKWASSERGPARFVPGKIYILVLCITYQRSNWR
jgi:hypothetical protein